MSRRTALLSAGEYRRRGFVKVDRQSLTLGGEPYRMHGATTYAQLSNVAGLVSLAGQAGLTVLEAVEFEAGPWRDLSTVMTEATWTRIDNLIAACRTAGLKVLINLSSYGHILAANGTKPTTHNWASYLQFVTGRVNTVTGVRYRDDPTIAKWQVYAEIDAPNYSAPQRGTTAETTAFFARTIRQLRDLAPNHVVSSGGFSYINDPGSGIDWQTIMSDPLNQVCDIEINSTPDRDVAVPAVAAHAATLGKPWFLSAFSSCQGTPGFEGDANHYPTDTLMAAHFEDVYRLAYNPATATTPAPAQAACGAHFWNLANTPAVVNNCDIGEQYPATLAKARQWSPTPTSAGGLGTAPLGTSPLGS
jgi:hypothetical protein